MEIIFITEEQIIGLRLPSDEIKFCCRPLQYQCTRKFVSESLNDVERENTIIKVLSGYNYCPHCGEGIISKREEA